MKPPPFSYHDPATIDEAVQLLGSLDNARVLAGGQSLMPMLNMRYAQPDHLIDLRHIGELARTEFTVDEVVIGGMVRQCSIERDPVVAERLPLLREALLQVGHRQTRNMGTLGGSLCHMDPAAEMVAVATAFEAVVEALGPTGARRIAFGDFTLGYMTPALGSDEMLTAVRYRPWPRGHGFAFIEHARRHGDFAIVSAAVMMTLSAGGKVERAVLVLGGVGDVPLTMDVVTEQLIGRVPTADLIEQACRPCSNIVAMEDATVPADYRRRLAVTLSHRALALAHERALDASSAASGGSA